MKMCPQCQCPALDDTATCLSCGASLNPTTTPEPRAQTGDFPLPSTTRIEAAETPLSPTPAPPPVYSGGTDEFVAVPSTVSIANLDVIAAPTAPAEPPTQKSGTADFVAVPASAVLSPTQKSGTADFVAVPANENIQPNTELVPPVEVQASVVPLSPPVEVQVSVVPLSPPVEVQASVVPLSPPVEVQASVVPLSPPVEVQKVVPPPPPPQSMRRGISGSSPSSSVPVLAESLASPQSIPPSPAPFATFPQTAFSSPAAEPAQPAQSPHLVQPIQPFASPQSVALSTDPQAMPSSFSPQPAFVQPISAPPSVVIAETTDIAPMRDFGVMDTERPEVWVAEEPDTWEATSPKPSRLPLIMGGAGVVLLITGALWMGLFSSNAPPVSRKDPAPLTQTKTEELPLARGGGGTATPRAVAALSPEKKGQVSDAKPLIADAKDQASDANPSARNADVRASEPKDPSNRQAAPAPSRRVEEDAPAERRSVGASEPATEPETRVSPRPRVRRVASRVRRPAGRKVRSRSGKCPAVAGMRALRLRSVGMPLRKVMIRVQGSVVTPDAQGCIQIPASVNVVMLAYQPDVTAYHLCQMKLSPNRSTLRFALVDANIAPPADGGCSK